MTGQTLLSEASKDFFCKWKREAIPDELKGRERAQRADRRAKSSWSEKY